LFVFDQGWNARLWSGSANATWRAFHGNVEFLVELRGSRASCGVDKLLARPARADWPDLLEEFQPLRSSSTRRGGRPSSTACSTRSAPGIASRPLRLV